jgi:hypothetical protein
MNMKIRTNQIWIGLLLVFSTVLSSACSGITGPQTNTQMSQPNAPQTGKTTLYGRVTNQSGAPIPNVPVRLAEVFRQGDEGAYVLDGAFSPGDMTDEQGGFVIENVDPREYVIVVGDVEQDRYQIITKSDGSAEVYNPSAGELLNLETLSVSLVWP